MAAEEVAPREPSRGSLLGRVTVTTEPLKFDENGESERKEENNNSEGPLSWGMGFWLKRTDSPPEHETSFGASSVSSRSSSSIASNKRQLAFKEDVTVIPIPRRDEYSNRIRERLWQSAGKTCSLSLKKLFYGLFFLMFCRLFSLSQRKWNEMPDEML